MQERTTFPSFGSNFYLLTFLYVFFSSFMRSQPHWKLNTYLKQISVHDNGVYTKYSDVEETVENNEL